MRSPSLRLALGLSALLIIALTLFAYRGLPPRPFAADDFQWLIGATSLSFGDMLRSAFDANQNHFYRPLVWVLFWLQANMFGLNQRGYHAVSLALHLANALLLGMLAFRLLASVQQARNHGPSFGLRLASFALPAAIVALHPAPFEAIVWISAQSELLAAFWLLLMLHMWHGRNILGATVMLALALLTKESAVIALPLLVLLDPRPLSDWRGLLRLRSLAAYALPALLTAGYLAIQLRVERENYVVDQGSYGVGPQLVLNPLRALGLLVAPLPGTERADAPWLVVVGALVALGLLFALVRGPAPIRRAALALGLTLLPTAPFAGPPNSRYLYLTVMAGAVLLALLVRHVASQPVSVRSSRARMALPLAALALAVVAAAELSAREFRFAVGTGAEGSLWQLARGVCAERTPDRVILLNPPIVEIHVRASLDLACGDAITPIFVDTMEIAEANLEPNSLIIEFPGGVAHIAKRT